MARTATLTVAALVGGGLTTIGFALGGVSALGDDLASAGRLTPPPVLSPEEERTARPASELRDVRTTTGGALRLKDACDRAHRRPGGATDPGAPHREL